MSEGIDFADKAGRGVILTGLPYAPSFDAKVRSSPASVSVSASDYASDFGLVTIFSVTSGIWDKRIILT